MSSVPLQVQFDPAAARFGASRSQKRLEDDRLLTGRGRYSDDLELPNQCWLVLARSPHAHARIRAVDLAAVKGAPGVIAAWTMAELRLDGVGHMPFPPLFKRADGSPMAAPPRAPLAEGEVRYVGQPVVAVVAETRGQAQDAAGLGRAARAGTGCRGACRRRVRGPAVRGGRKGGHRARCGARLAAGGGKHRSRG